jgi:sigma-B regulation protein RsbU (phosphoserine phosphatase)
MTDDLKHRIAQLEHQVQNYERLLRQANDKLLQLAGEIASDLDWALKLQKKLVPTELPAIKGFEFSSKFIPGSRFGGDYFDIFEHDDRWKFGVFISSCSGYTVSSALMGLLIKFSTQIEAKRGLSPDQFLNQLASELIASFKDADRASLFYGVVDRKTLELHYCSAGMISVYRQEYGKDAIEFLEPVAAEFAPGFRANLTTRTVNLNSGDRLVICTPGLLAASEPDGRAWGAENLVDAWRSAAKKGVHELRNEILYKQQSYQNSQEPLRDQSLIVMEVQDRIIKLA